MKTKYWLLLILIAIIVGFFLGRDAIVKQEVEHVKGKTVYGSLNPDFLTVKKEFKGDIKFLPYIFWKGDTVKINEIEYISTIPDTAKIVEDFLVKREYEFTVFDNENGKLDVNLLIQYNRLLSFNYTYTPILKQITSYKQPLFQPFTSISYNTIGYTGLGIGTFIKNFGVEYKYNVNLLNFSTIVNVNNYHEFGVKFKF